jgi:vanillate O-demethylase monooxygenase subunit
VCIEIPGMAEVPPKARVRRYPVVVKNHWVFAWMGDVDRADRADPAALPDNFSCGDPDWPYKPGYLHYGVNWQLIADNLLDFSHLSYVHEKTLGGTPAIAQARAQIDKVPGGLRITRHVRNVPPPPFYTRMRTFDGNIDRHFVYDFLLPATLLMNSGGRPAGAPDDSPPLVKLHSCQALTPETETSTHYFFMQAAPAALGGAGLVDNIHASLVQAFDEDRDMITAQARIIAMKPDVPMLPLAMDSAVVQFRRLVDEALRAEGQRPAS